MFTSGSLGHVTNPRRNAKARDDLTPVRSEARDRQRINPYRSAFLCQLPRSTLVPSFSLLPTTWPEELSTGHLRYCDPPRGPLARIRRRVS